jgi:hypothetical protein
MVYAAVKPSMSRLHLLVLSVVLCGVCSAATTVAVSAKQGRAVGSRSMSAPALVRGGGGSSAFFTFTGFQWGEKDSYGFISPAKPYAKTGHLFWNWQWEMHCSTEFGELVLGAQFGCAGPVTITGNVDQTFTDPVLGQDCTGKIVAV